MRPLSFLADQQVPLVLDTSVVINLIATGCAATIVEAVPNPMVVTEMILDELKIGKDSGRADADHLGELVSSRHLEVVTLCESGWQHFEGLVSGPAAKTLDDGEAATIAYAAEQGAIAVIDEKKATRICGERFPQVLLASTIDIFLHQNVRKALGRKGLCDALFDALQNARMGVFPHHQEAVVEIIGHERAAQCGSLPKTLRIPSQ